MRKSNSGLALVQVMLIFALLAIVAANMQVNQRFEIARTIRLIDQATAREYSSFGEMMTRQALAELDPNKDADTRFEVDAFECFSLTLPEIVPGVEFGLYAQDLDGKFNLNWLSMQNQNRANWIAGFKKMLSNLDVPTELGDNVAAWFDPDSSAQFVYGGKSPSYSASNLPMGDISELRLIDGMTEEHYLKLRPYVAALPFDSKLNLNTAHEPVLHALSVQLSDTEISNIFSNQLVLADGQCDNPPRSTGDAYTSIQDINSVAGFNQEKPAPFDENLVSFKSQFYEVLTEITINDHTTFVTSLLYRGQNNFKVLSRNLTRQELYQPG